MTPRRELPVTRFLYFLYIFYISEIVFQRHQLMSALPASGLVSNVPLYFAHRQMFEAWTFLRDSSRGAGKNPKLL